MARKGCRVQLLRNAKMHHLDEKHVVFGQVVKGEEVISHVPWKQNNLQWGRNGKKAWFFLEVMMDKPSFLFDSTAVSFQRKWNGSA